MEIVTALLGEPAISRFSLANLAGKYQRAQLFDKLLNFGGEISHTSEVKWLKILASGEPVTAKHSHTPTFLMQQYGRFWFNANELPAHPQVTEAFYRRLIVVPFNEDIAEPDRNEHIVQTIIEKELSGIFNWVLKGLERLSRQKGFTQNPTESALFTGYEGQKNNVSLFIEEIGYEKCANDGILLSELYLQYREYCIGNDYPPLAKRYFNEQLKSLGVIVERRREGNTVLLAKTGE